LAHVERDRSVNNLTHRQARGKNQESSHWSSTRGRVNSGKRKETGVKKEEAFPVAKRLLTAAADKAVKKLRERHFRKMVALAQNKGRRKEGNSLGTIAVPLEKASPARTQPHEKATLKGAAPKEKKRILKVYEYTV